MDSGQLVVMTFHPDGSGKANLSFIPLGPIGRDGAMPNSTHDALGPAVQVVSELLRRTLGMPGSEHGLKGAEVEVWWLQGMSNERLWPPVPGEEPEAAPARVRVERFPKGLQE